MLGLRATLLLLVEGGMGRQGCEQRQASVCFYSSRLLLDPSLAYHKVHKTNSLSVTKKDGKAEYRLFPQIPMHASTAKMCFLNNMAENTGMSKVCKANFLAPFINNISHNNAVSEDFLGLYTHGKTRRESRHSLQVHGISLLKKQTNLWSAFEADEMTSRTEKDRRLPATQN